MKKLNSIFILLGLSLSYSLAFAATPQAVPQAFMYQGQPIDPLCFYEGNAKASVSLLQCGIHAEPNRTAKSHNPYLVNLGFTGYDYSWKSQPSSPSLLGFSYYKVLGKTNNGYLIYSLNNGGGSGVFSSIALVNRHNTQLTITPLFSGDRCNSGIVNAKLNNNILIFSINLSPFEFLDLAQDNPHKLRPYDDLDACATCCVATATFSKNMQIKKNNKLLYVTLKPKDELQQNPSAKYQKCFNSLLDDYRQLGKTKLNFITLKTLVSQFNERCVN